MVPAEVAAEHALLGFALSMSSLATAAVEAGASEPNRRTSSALIYAIVVHWRTPELTPRAVESLVTQALDSERYHLRVLVVDNGSADLPPSLCHSELSEESVPPQFQIPNSKFQVLALDTNLGFAGGANAGIRQALDEGADYVFLLNSDAVAEPACVAELLTAAEAQPHAGIVGAVLVDERTGLVQNAGQRFNRLTGRHTEIARGRTPEALPAEPCAVDSVSGGALLARREVFERGLLDEQLFLYFEDMDFCLRAGHAGFGVIVAPAARATHRGGGSIGEGSPLTTYYSVRNHIAVSRRHRGTVQALLVASYHLARLATTRELRTASHLRAWLRGASDGSTGRLGMAEDLG